MDEYRERFIKKLVHKLNKKCLYSEESGYTYWGQEDPFSRTTWTIDNFVGEEHLICNRPYCYKNFGLDALCVECKKIIEEYERRYDDRFVISQFEMIQRFKILEEEIVKLKTIIEEIKGSIPKNVS